MVLFWSWSWSCAHTWKCSNSDRFSILFTFYLNLPDVQDDLNKILFDASKDGNSNIECGAFVIHFNILFWGFHFSWLVRNRFPNNFWNDIFELSNKLSKKIYKFHKYNAITGDLSEVKNAVKIGANIKNLDDKGQTAQDVASENGKLEMAIHVLEKKHEMRIALRLLQVTWILLRC